MAKSAHTDSPMLEKVFDSFMASCLNYQANVEFTDVAKYVAGTPTAAHVALVGTLAELKADSVKALPFYSAAVGAAIERVSEGGSFTVFADAECTKRVTVGAIPTEASRHNCPYRPDVVGQMVQAAAKEVKTKDQKEQQVVDVFVRAPAGAERAISAAIARASGHSFSVKSEQRGTGFLYQPIRYNVVFSTRNMFTGEAVEGKVVTSEELKIIATSVQLCQRLVDAPSNLVDPVTFADIAVGYAEALGCTAEVIKGDELRERGYGGIYNVGKAAEFPPHLVTLTFKNPASGSKSAVKNVALVGKGITYDTGGLAIKTPATNMVGMKMDMGGAAALLCAFVAVVRTAKVYPNQFPNVGTLSVTLCIADNAVGPKSYRNGDMLILKSGKSVEIHNTDAEGRLVLADGVFHATNEQSFVPDVLIDMATLTGAQGITTGDKHAAILVNEEETEKAVLEAGKKCGDTCFPLLYCPEYYQASTDNLHCDTRNLTKRSPQVGTADAGQFMAEQLSEKFKGTFCHVDIAYPAFNTQGATGYGVNLMVEYLRSL